MICMLLPKILGLTVYVCLTVISKKNSYPQTTDNSALFSPLQGQPEMTRWRGARSPSGPAGSFSCLRGKHMPTTRTSQRCSGATPMLPSLSTAGRSRTFQGRKIWGITLRRRKISARSPVFPPEETLPTTSTLPMEIKSRAPNVMLRSKAFRRMQLRRERASERARI